MRRTTSTRRASQTGFRVGVGFLALCLLVAAPRAAWPEGLDLCGCAAEEETRGAFDTNDNSTFEAAQVTFAGSISNTYDRLHIAVPEDGILIFDSFNATNIGNYGKTSRIYFIPSQSNAPVRILVKGDFTLNTTNQIYHLGGPGGEGTTTQAGQGGRAGVGGFAGGDGAFPAGNLTSHGGSGIGPGGGLGGNALNSENPILADGGEFFGAQDLRPLVGGSGGGGGYSLGTEGCSGGGGGGGGGGALQIVANGTIKINGQIYANGGKMGGTTSSDGCAGTGSGGSGGAILLIADTISGSGTIWAAGGDDGGTEGSVRMEAITNTFSGAADHPVAVKIAAPGPAVAAATPSVAITHVTGANMSLEESLPPEFPQGFNGEIDLIVPQAGTVTFSFETQRVPSGTELELAVKPNVGGGPKKERVTLGAGASHCSAGVCNADLDIELDPGAYVAEARATFEVPSGR